VTKQSAENYWSWTISEVCRGNILLNRKLGTAGGQSELRKQFFIGTPPVTPALTDWSPSLISFLLCCEAAFRTVNLVFFHQRQLSTNHTRRPALYRCPGPFLNYT